MKWSWKIGRLFGIDIYLHSTFLILLAWVGISHWMQGNDLLDAAHGLVFLVSLFSIVVLHELGHALAARHYGISTRDITLLPIGGVARLDHMPDDPKQELVVALAGPAVNAVLAVLCALIIGLLAGLRNFQDVVEQGLGSLQFMADHPEALEKLSELPLIGSQFVARLLLVNIVLLVFNLLPAFPMDGGRVLRALLAMRMDYVQATQIAASIGQGMAYVFGFLGLFYNPFLVFIALFVWMGATSESSLVQIQDALGGIPVMRAMITRFQTVSPDASIDDVADHIIAGFQQDFPVVDDGAVIGIVTRERLVNTMARSGREALVRDCMETSFESLRPGEMLEGAFAKLQNCDCRTMPVVQDGRLVGILNLENLGEFIAIRSAGKAFSHSSDSLAT